jgi:hypothetical protein
MTGDRSGQAWQTALTPLSRMEFVVSDAALGISAGVRALAKARAQQAAAAGTAPTPLTQGLDVFHTAMEAERVLGGYWRRAEAVWDKAAQADRGVAELQQQGQNAQRQATLAYQAWCQAEKAFAVAQRCETAWKRAHAALQIFRPDGVLNDRGWVEAEIRASLADLSDLRWRKTRGFLRDKRTLAFLDRMHQRLAAAVPDAQLREVCLRRYGLRHHEAATATATPTPPLEQLIQVLDAKIRDGALSSEEQAAYDRVKAVLATTIRASSAVEGSNSVTRMHQCRHRRMSQGLLDLKRLYWNSHKLATGRRRGRSPYEMLGLALPPTTDFWTLLQSSPAQLAELVSSVQLRE